MYALLVGWAVHICWHLWCSCTFVWFPQKDSEADIKIRRLRLWEVDLLQVTWLLGGKAGIRRQVCMSSNPCLLRWEWHTSSQVAGFLCLYPSSGGPPSGWVELVIKKTGGKRMVGSEGKRMDGSGQTQLCQWTSCSKCLSYCDSYFQKMGFWRRNRSYGGICSKQTFVEHLHMLGILPSPRETDEQHGHTHK